MNVNANRKAPAGSVAITLTRGFRPREFPESHRSGARRTISTIHFHTNRNRGGEEKGDFSSGKTLLSGQQRHESYDAPVPSNPAGAESGPTNLCRLQSSFHREYIPHREKHAQSQGNAVKLCRFVVAASPSATGGRAFQPRNCFLLCAWLRQPTTCRTCLRKGPRFGFPLPSPPPALSPFFFLFLPPGRTLIIIKPLPRTTN